MSRRAGAVALVAVLAACSREPVYHGEGDVVAVDSGASQVTLRHDDVPGLMPAMTMAFPVRPAAVLDGIAPGRRVRFDLVREGALLVLTRLQPLDAAGGGRPGVHDHTPHHGGVVAMVGLLHLEALASRDGHVRVYLSDVWRRPVPLDGVTGTVTAGLPGQTPTLPLVAAGDALEATGAPAEGAELPAHVRLERAGQPIEMHFLLPLAAGGSGGAAPSAGCKRAEPRGAGRQPRCVIAFGLPVTAIATTSDARRALVAAVNNGVTSWRLPAGDLELGFDAPPPVAVSADEPPHGDAANALGVAPDGRETVVALDRRLLRYATDTGRLVRPLAAPGGMIRSVAWSADGRLLLVGTSGDRAGHVLRADDGTESRRIPLELEATAVTTGSDGLGAVGSEAGTIALVDLGPHTAARTLAASAQVIDALALAGNRLLSGGADGSLRVWNARPGTLAGRLDFGNAILRIAVAPGGGLAAVALRDWSIRVVDLARLAPVAELTWHHAGVNGLAWAGSTLVSGDTEGAVALWDLADVAGTS